MDEPKKKGRRPGNLIGEMLNASGLFRRALGNAQTSIGKYLVAEHVESLIKLRDELEEARKAITGLLGGMGATLDQMAYIKKLEAENLARAQQIAYLSEQLSITGHSDKLSPEQREIAKGAGRRLGRPKAQAEHLAAV